MSPPRVYVPTLPADGHAAVTGDSAHHLARVLRVAVGDVVCLFDGSGREVEAVIATVAREAVTARIAAELPPAPPEWPVHLYQALIRPSRFELLLEKAAELGASSIRPVVTARCQVRAAEFGAVRAARRRRILMEASEQCGRRSVPDLATPAPFERALPGAPGALLLAWETERAAAPSLGDVVRALRRDGPAGESAAGEFSLLIGPEGGFTAAEAAAARARGAVAVSLGPRILRAETAALAALAVIADALHEGGATAKAGAGATAPRE